jgi:hypothetical protein
MSQLNKTMRNYRIHTASPEPTSLQLRATCNYHSPCVQQVTNLFQRTNWRIGFRSWNTIYKLLKHQKGINSKCVLVRVATRSKGGLQPLACWDCGFKSCQGHGCCEYCVLSRRGLCWWADHSSRGVLPTVVNHCVWSQNLKCAEAMAHVGRQSHRKN